MIEIRVVFLYTPGLYNGWFYIARVDGGAMAVFLGVSLFCNDTFLADVRRFWCTALSLIEIDTRTSVYTHDVDKGRLWHSAPPWVGAHRHHGDGP